MISDLVLPLIVFFVIVYGVLKKVSVYDVFIEGAKESFDMILKLFPCLLAMIFFFFLFVKSNIVANLFSFISFIPNELIPLIITRPISGTSSLAILTTIYESFGPDGFVGTLASYIQGTTDTTFYILTLYFGSVGIKKIRYSLWAGLFADLCSIIISILVAYLIL